MAEIDNKKDISSKTSEVRVLSLFDVKTWLESEAADND